MPKLTMPNPQHATYAEMREAAGKNLNHLTSCLLNHIMLFHSDPENALATLRFTTATLERKLLAEIEKRKNSHAA